MGETSPKNKAEIFINEPENFEHALQTSEEIKGNNPKLFKKLFEVAYRISQRTDQPLSEPEFIALPGLTEHRFPKPICMFLRLNEQNELEIYGHLELHGGIAEVNVGVPFDYKFLPHEVDYLISFTDDDFRYYDVSSFYPID